jgi:hypothetical protein
MSPLPVTSDGTGIASSSRGSREFFSPTDRRCRGPHRDVEPGATPPEAPRTERGHSRFNGLRPTFAFDAIDKDADTVLGGVKGLFAALTGSAALDPACARCRRAFIDGVISFVRRDERS